MADSRTYYERIQILGSELADTVKKLIADGSVRRIVLKDERGNELASIPMNLGAAVGAAAVLWNPFAALVAGTAAAIGAPLAKLTIEIERTDIVEGEAVETTAAEASAEHPSSAQASKSAEESPAAEEPPSVEESQSSEEPPPVELSTPSEEPQPAEDSPSAGGAGTD